MSSCRCTEIQAADPRRHFQGCPERKPLEAETGVDLITRERQRQIAKLGYDQAHDDEHDDGSLAWAAVCYAAPEKVYQREDFETCISFSDPWPWDVIDDARPKTERYVVEPEKATKEQRVRLLTKAGALIAAEIDRLLREDGS